jgi:hypothetical protein
MDGEVVVPVRRRILVAVDEGDESVHALRWCLGTFFAARGAGDTVILLYVRPAPPAYSVLDASGECLLCFSPAPCSVSGSES